MRLMSSLLLLVMASIAGPAALAQDVVDCNAFWRNGMPLPGHAGGPIYCREYLPAPGSDALLTGDEYRIFLAQALDPGAPDIHTRLGWLAEGIDETAGAYHWLGGAARFYIYMSPMSPTAARQISLIQSMHREAAATTTTNRVRSSFTLSQ
ncbi:MAG: hypothetical protein KDI09_18650 [Halioglobus sp.]|nr:hypothetical protein [Halioglobus sp.]